MPQRSDVRAHPATAIRLALHLKGLTDSETTALARIAGVPGRMAVRARRGLRTDVRSYLLLCSATVLDARAGGPAFHKRRPAFAVGWSFLSSALWLRRAFLG